MNVREVPGQRGWCAWPEPFGRVSLGPAGGRGVAGHRKESKNHCWVGLAQTCCKDGNEKHCWGLDGGGAGPNMYCAEPQACREGSKNTAWGSVGRARSGVPKDLSTPDVFCLSSTRHRKVVQNPQATEKREVVQKNKHCWGLGVSPSKCGPESPLCILLRRYGENIFFHFKKVVAHLQYVCKNSA